MIGYDRQQSILKLLEEKRTTTVRELAAKVFASEASVRRDLETLEAQGYVKRVYGGVLLARNTNTATPVGLREGDHAAAKNEIARRAAAMIPAGSTVMLDASSTTRRILKYVENLENLRIFTNNLHVFEEVDRAGAEVYCTGGMYRPRSHAFVGPAAENFVRSVSVDILFFSSQGITEDGEISDVCEEETHLRRVMLSRAKKKILLCDSSKIGVRGDFLLCRREDVDMIICDKKLPWEETEG